ncbi:MAG: M23 family metallopeptidase [Patescibacteria group bacterium]
MIKLKYIFIYPVCLVLLFSFVNKSLAGDTLQQLDKSVPSTFDSRGVPVLNRAEFQTLNWNADFDNPQLTLSLQGSLSFITLHFAPIFDPSFPTNSYRISLIDRGSNAQGGSVVRASGFIPYSIEGDYTFHFEQFFFNPNNAYDIRLEIFGFSTFFGSNDPSSYPFGRHWGNGNISDLYFITDARVSSNKMTNPTVGGRVTQFFKPLDNPTHNGIDIDSDIVGTPAYSAAAGKIIYMTTTTESSCGKWVWVFHGDINKLDDTTVSKISTVYLHLDHINSDLKIGDDISQGTSLGIVDNTGIVMGGHLHFGVKNGDPPAVITCKNRVGDTTVPLNPLDFVDYEVKPQSLSFNLRSNADLIVTDPDGLVVSKQKNDLAGSARYLEVKHVLDGGAEEGLPEYDEVQIDQRKIGDYLINIVPEPQASPTSTFSLSGSLGTSTMILVKDILISDTPNQSYILRSAEGGVEEVVPVKIRIDPETLNLDRKGIFTIFLTISKGLGFSISDIDSQAVNIQGALVTRTSIANNTFMMKFNTQDLKNITSGDKIKFKVSGKFKSGVSFEGFDTIRVTNNKSVIAEILRVLSGTLANLLNIVEHNQSF